MLARNINIVTIHRPDHRDSSVHSIIIKCHHSSIKVLSFTIQRHFLQQDID